MRSDKEAKMRRILLPSCRPGLTARLGVRLVHVYPWVVRVFLIVVMWIWMMALWSPATIMDVLIY